MPLDLPYSVKTVEGATNLTLYADPGESFRVRSIRIVNAASSYITVTIDNVTVGYWRVSATIGNHLHFPLVDDQKLNLFEALVSGGVFRPIPIATGQTLKISGAAAATAIQQVIYTKHAEGEVKPTEPNGTAAKEYDYVAYGRCSGTLANGENAVSVAVNPGQFSGFPYSDDVPAKAEISVKGVAVQDIGIALTSIGNSCISDFIKFVHMRTTLGDEDNHGLLLQGLYSAGSTKRGEGYSDVGDFSTIDMRMPLFFSPPLKFGPGEDLDVYVSVTKQGTGANLSGGMFDVGLLLTRRDLT
jgi:hypothetical protein